MSPILAALAVAVAVGAATQGSICFGHALLALEPLPCLLVGPWGGHWVVERLDERWPRPAVLAFATIAGAVIVFLGS